MDPLIEGDERWVRAAEALYPRRIDAIVRTSAGWYIVEAKPRAADKAVGQAVVYAYLFLRDCPQCVLAGVVILTDAADVEAREVAELLGVEVVELGGVEAVSQSAHRVG